MKKRVRTFIGLRSNLGSRKKHLRTAIAQLERIGYCIEAISPPIETPAVLPTAAPGEWNIPFINIAIKGTYDHKPEDLLQNIKFIERQINLDTVRPPAPQSIRIYLLLFGDAIRRESPDLVLPYPNLTDKSWLLTPMVALAPRLTIPALGSKTLIEWSQALRHKPPMWMGIVNVTPDSFSDGAFFVSPEHVMTYVDSLVSAGAHIVDLGAESTRPGAQPLTAKEEWARLEPILPMLLEHYRTDPLRPRFSLDTYHTEVARRGIELGVDIINDVTGLSSAGMLDLARSSQAEFIAMHHLSVPASESRRLSRGCDPLAIVDSWLLQMIEAWDRSGLNLERVLFDPGVGFGKTSLQSLALIQHAARFRRHGLRVLVGHSRKSFLDPLASADLIARDRATLGASLHLCTQGVDVIRVHDVGLHAATHRGWMQFQESQSQSDVPSQL